MHKCLHFWEVCWFSLLTHNIFDLFGQSRIILVSENIVTPTYLDSSPIKINVILEDVLVIPHLQIVNGIFGICSWVNRTKLSTENMHKGRPIVQPIGIIGQPGEGWLKEVKSHTMKVSQCKGNLCVVIAYDKLLWK